jgi:hypothetical protein
MRAARAGDIEVWRNFNSDGNDLVLKPTCCDSELKREPVIATVLWGLAELLQSLAERLFSKHDRCLRRLASDRKAW